jgi:hypothetical protein
MAKVRLPRRVRNADTFPISDQINNTPPRQPFGYSAAWLRRQYPLSPARAQLIASLLFGDTEGR